ncbi:MAG: lysine--tRNA ligase [Dehalococcoidia bacterium]|nr:MAG: lysine--tRNA ligase [Dehalococcoidia bacterium]
MPSRIDSIVQQRLNKLERIRQRGIDPYPHRYHRTHTTKEAVALFEKWEGSGGNAPQVSLAGRIMASRPMGKATFIDIRDSSGKIQVCFRSDSIGENYQLLKEFDIGDILGVSGRIFRTKSGEVTLEASDFSLLSKSLQPLPEKWHGLTDVEKRYRQRYLDLISNEEVGRIFAVRSRAIASMRRFLDGRGFVEVETPVLHPTAGGALARPFATHHRALDQDLFLRIATELYLKRLIIGGLDKVYEIGRIFRNEGISIKHNPEFTMLESYEAYADYNDVMNMVEEMVSYVAQEVLGTNKVSFAGNTLDFNPPWQRITLRDAINKGCGIDFEEHLDEDSLRRQVEAIGLDVSDIRGRGKLIDKLISSYVEPNLIQPTFVMDYPIELSPLAKRKPGSERLVERFEAFVGGMEIANAFTELNDPIEQRERFQEQEIIRAQLGDEEAERVDEDFLLALEHGMPPTGGLGLGIDRLVMLLTDQPSIREVILFPQLRTK